MRKLVLSAIFLLCVGYAYAQQFPVGFALIDTQNGNRVVQIFGGLTPGIEQSTPPVITLPNGDVVYAPAAGPVGAGGRWRLVPRILDTKGSDPSLPMLDATSTFDGTSVIVTPSYGTPAIPQLITAMQLKVALQRLNKLTPFINWINTQPAETQLKWTSMIFVTRFSPMILAAAASLNQTPAQIDAIFTEAGTVTP